MLPNPRSHTYVTPPHPLKSHSVCAHKILFPPSSPKGLQNGEYAPCMLHVCSMYAPRMLHGCSNYAPRMLPGCSATPSHFLVKQQIPFSTLIKTPKPHPSSKYPPIIPISHPPFSRRECDEYPHPPIFTLIPKTQLLNPPPHHSSSPLTPYPTTTYPQQIFSTPTVAPPVVQTPPASSQGRKACYPPLAPHGRCKDVAPNVLTLSETPLSLNDYGVLSPISPKFPQPYSQKIVLI